MRQVLIVLLSIIVIMSTACENTRGRAAPQSPSADEGTSLQATPKPTFTISADTNTPDPVATQSVAEQAQDGTNTTNLPLVGTDSSSPTPAATETSPSATPEAQETDDEDDEDDEPKMLTLRDDLPAMSLQEWPRPAGDNGRCMHFVRDQYFTEDVLNRNLARLQQLGAKWVVVVYADENVLNIAASRFAEAGIVPVWRKMVRPFESYYNWKRDIEIVESYGLPPYFQLYNEPSLTQEWQDRGSTPDREEAIKNLMQATQDVYNAGGYVGWQFIEPDWLQDALDALEARGGEKVLERFFFVPHPYGLNHPPDYIQDINSALGFRVFADIFRDRYGFVPPMIAGEGGWKINNDADPRFPKITDELHRDYHVEVFRWFETGVMSNGEPLPDYLFAYCPWLIAGKMDDNAWWDSFAGDRELTIEAVSNMPPFVRRFSWDQ